MSLTEAMANLWSREQDPKTRLKDDDPAPVCPPDLQEPDGSCPTVPDVVTGGDSPPDTP